MTEEQKKQDPVEKFRKLIASFIPLSRLPKKEPARQEAKPDVAPAPAPGADKNILLNSLPKKTASGKNPPAPKPSPEPDSSPSASEPGPRLNPAVGAGTSVWYSRFWTTASVISLTINVLMAVILVILVISVYRLKLDMEKVMNASTALMGLPRGLYTNFEMMERASIETNVVVDASIPVKFDLQLNQATNVVLSQDVTITNAKVTVNTGGLNITQANTTIILPAGTVLPVTLNLTVPVDKQIPITLNVPVNIPLSATSLNDPFIGLQEVIKPIYCILEPAAVDMDGQPICP